MEVTYDPEKDALNIKDPGVSLGRAQDFDLEYALVEADLREDYGEERWNALGTIEGNLNNLCLTVRDGLIRPIRLRKASKKEGKTYAQLG